LTDRPLQCKESIPELRKSKGRIIFTSSGAAAHAYASWGPYGSSKAAANSLAAHIAVEEPDIVTVAVTPGRVNTGMQQELRDHGKEKMSEQDYARFVSDFDQGRLADPKAPGGVIARLSVEATPDLSGKYLRYVGLCQVCHAC
jgi:NAD(P)-dependent dehydrogenase (short-subunit alcohol dehydrogenase family)